jgi:hypothetical protein
MAVRAAASDAIATLTRSEQTARSSVICHLLGILPEVDRGVNGDSMRFEIHLRGTRPLLALVLGFVRPRSLPSRDEYGNVDRSDLTLKGNPGSPTAVLNPPVQGT